MSRLVWLVSYPKSGNTWVRVLFANYHARGGQPADINDLDNSLLAAARLPFDDLAGVCASSLTRAEIDRGRVEVMRLRASESGTPKLVKVHDCFRYLPNGTALFPHDVTESVAYIIRNPLDVVISFAHHTGKSIDATIDDLCCPSFAMAAATDRLPEQLPQVIGSWSDHVRSWVDTSGFAVEVVRYEDLVTDPEATFSRLVRVAGWDVDAARVATAITHSRFEALRAQEEASGFRERPARAERFFRRGTSGAWAAELTTAQVDRIVAAHGEMMERFGYWPLTSPPSSGSGAPGAGRT